MSGVDWWDAVACTQFAADDSQGMLPFTCFVQNVEIGGQCLSSWSAFFSQVSILLMNLHVCNQNVFTERARYWGD